MSANQFSALQLSSDELRALIALRAFKIYQQRGERPGDHLSDWLKAEAEVLASLGIPPKEVQPKKKPLARAAAANGGVVIRRISVDGVLLT
jgi:hypothetical protein